jgi:hypothetical protein
VVWTLPWTAALHRPLLRREAQEKAAGMLLDELKRWTDAC